MGIFVSEDECKNFRLQAQSRQGAHEGAENDEQAIKETAYVSEPLQQTVSLPLPCRRPSLKKPSYRKPSGLVKMPYPSI